MMLMKSFKSGYFHVCKLGIKIFSSSTHSGAWRLQDILRRTLLVLVGFHGKKLFKGGAEALRKLNVWLVTCVMEARNHGKQVLHFSAGEIKDKLLNSNSKIGRNCNILSPPE